MSLNQGSISIEAQNIMPIIKKWLYSDKDIFIRELVANGVDAITKHTILEPGAVDNYRVIVTVDKEKGTLCFDDNGIGMTAEEVEKYINQVAFSSAEEFLKNYKGDEADKTGGIIGHFGLGFYSAFMVAKKVSILTKSYREGSEAVLWESEDGMRFSMQPAKKEGFGTCITLEIAEDETEFLDSYRVREVLTRYCEFMKVPVYLVSEEEIQAAEKAAQEAAEKNENKEASGSAEAKTPQEQGTHLISDSQPLWLKKPADCTEEEYKEFYRKAFKTWEDPLFQVHLNVDYPFNLKGILYFPRIKKDFGSNQGQIKLFTSQVFVAENIKEIIPEYLMLLNGVIDCPDLPLNVSRSYLQNDSFVAKLKAYITRKVADRLLHIFNTDRTQYEGYWDDINPFIKYGCLSDKKFYEQMKDALLLKTDSDSYLTIQEYLDKNDKTEKKIYYAADKKRQAAAIALYTGNGIDVAILNMLIDNSFISFLEFEGGYEGLKFVRVDADVDSLESKEALSEELKTAQESLIALFQKSLAQDGLQISLRELKDEHISAVLLQDEQGRRFAEMSKIYGQSFQLPQQHTLVLNAKSPAILALSKRSAEDADAQLICRQLYDLSKMATRPLEDNEVTEFLTRSNQILNLLLK